MARFSELGKRLDKAISKGQTTYRNAKHWTENKVEENRDTIRGVGGAVSSAWKGGLNFGKGVAGSAFISDKAIRELENDVESQGGYYRELNRKIKTRHKGKDIFFLGGEMYMMGSLPVSFPAEIEMAYEAAYPNESALYSLGEKLEQIDFEEAGALVSGIKGKLFEMKYVDYLNDGNLPEGFTAQLAESANQPGWDISIMGPDGGVADLIQNKATASAAYVKEALEKYPDIDVVTTEEVYATLTMQGISDGLIDSGISNADLISTVTESLDVSDLGMDFVPPIVTLAMIAFTSYRDDSLSAFQKAQAFGDRTGKAYLSFLVGSGVAAVTNTWWLGPAATVLSRYVAEPGQRKWELYHELKRLKRNNQVVLDRAKGSV
jgi:hypothetical protein